MGSLKEELRGLREDHKPCEKANDKDGPGGSDGSAVPEGRQMSMSQGSASPEDHSPGLHMKGDYDEDKNPVSKELSQGVYNNGDQSESIGVNQSVQAVPLPLIQQSECDNTTAADGEMQEKTSEVKSKDKEGESKNITVPVPSTPGPYDPRSPAPEGYHHMRTQVSLEVVQCHSAATSPMTPSSGSHFYFPSSLEKSDFNTTEAELQVSHQVEFCSVATSPMTPKTPFTTAFGKLVRGEPVCRGERVKKSEEQEKGVQQEHFPAIEGSAEDESEIITSKELSEDFSSTASPQSSASCPAAGLTDTQETLADSNQQFKQQRLGRMDQDITITVTHYNNEEEEEEEADGSLDQDMIKIDECEEFEERISKVKEENRKESISSETVGPVQAQDMPNTKQTGEVSSPEIAQTDVKCEHSEHSCEDPRDITVTKPSVPESPAPFGCHNIRTQVSLEVVQCQSAATSPMTPPEGDHAFYFPSSFERRAGEGAQTKDAELQVGQRVEFRSVATAPMTPRTPTNMAFPDIRKGTSIEEKIVEEDEGKQEQLEVGKEEAKVAEEKADEEGSKEVRNCEEKCEEPVQEVSWDEKGMTWEVYGAVVEVAVLGSAIQKHLEKQVMKKRQPSMPPPPPLNPLAKPLSPESLQGDSGKGRAGKRRQREAGEVSQRRRNPFRLMMENMQQPHCCSKTHTTE